MDQITIQKLTNLLPNLRRVHFNEEEAVVAVRMVSLMEKVNIPQNKSELRGRFRSIRDSIAPDDIKRKSDIITAKIVSSDSYRDANVVFCYNSFGSEVDTKAICEAVLKSGRTLCVPVIKNGVMLPVRIRSFELMVKSSFGIYEPSEYEVIRDKNVINLTVVPGLAFNVLGFRLGYGKGFYDRFLSDYSGLSVGITFRECISDEITPDRFDVPVNFVVTD